VAIIVQSDDGTVVGANAYPSVAEFKAYHDARGNAYGSNDSLIEQAIVRATDYVDQRFKFRSTKLLQVQFTQFPRVLFQDDDGFDVEGIPAALKYAVCEYALRAMSAPLFQDAPAPDGGRIIDAITQKVDVLEQAITYAPSVGSGAFVMPAYPPADLMLQRAGLIIVGRTIVR
jgi:hypothetical protein